MTVFGIRSVEPSGSIAEELKSSLCHLNTCSFVLFSEIERRQQFR